MSISTYNGSAILAMSGKECVAIASDLRFGIQFQTLATDYQKTYQINDKVFVGLSGLGTDAQTLVNKFRFRHNLYKLREERDMRPTAFAHMVSSMLYEKRFGPFFCQPIVAGLEPDNTPFICGMDSLGCLETARDFICTGSAPDSLLGMAECMWRPDLGPEELFEVTAQCLLSGVDRDAISGWGGVVHLITKEGVTSRTLKGRMD